MVPNTHKKFHSKMLRSFENIEKNSQKCPTYGDVTLDLSFFFRKTYTYMCVDKDLYFICFESYFKKFLTIVLLGLDLFHYY